MNWAIVIALVIAHQVSKANPKLGGWLSATVTTGILLWGLSVYNTPGHTIALLGLPISRAVFLSLIAAFYGYDLLALSRAYRQTVQATGSSPSESVPPVAMIDKTSQED